MIRTLETCPRLLSSDFFSSQKGQDRYDVSTCSSGFLFLLPTMLRILKRREHGQMGHGLDGWVMICYDYRIGRSRR